MTQKTITVTGISANNKVYDGTTSAGFTGGTSSGIINGDVVTYTPAGTFSNKNVGVGKTVTLSGVTLGGTGAGNYSVSSYPATLTANISQRALTITAKTNTKAYDGNSNAAAVPTITSGVLQGTTVLVLQKPMIPKMWVLERQ